ncbi:MAG: heavy-metal-associated domain-containing protein [Kiritimatiellales bacterium]|nr:heavy-metal-associated domain-containing protein [Pontiella sp.]NNJ71216.1 heavy-metal-associated domain-containing protein [Kiritimatiellales bacterium]
MKTHTTILAITAALILAGCASTPKQEYSNTPLAQNEVVLTVHGMSCPLCSNNLDGQLEKIDGVIDMSVDLDTGAVTVKLSKGHAVSEQQLAGAVQAAGFSLAGIAEK